MKGTVVGSIVIFLGILTLLVSLAELIMIYRVSKARKEDFLFSALNPLSARTLEWIFLFILIVTILGAHYIGSMFSVEDKWGPSIFWMTNISLVATILLPAVIQTILWRLFRIPFGASITILCITLSEWIILHINSFYAVSAYPVTMVAPPIWIPSAFLLDIVLLLSQTYTLTYTMGGIFWLLIFYWGNFSISEPLLQPVKYYGLSIQIADLMQYQYERTGLFGPIYMLQDVSLGYWALLGVGIGVFYNVGRIIGNWFVKILSFSNDWVFFIKRERYISKELSTLEEEPGKNFKKEELARNFKSVVLKKH